jgi:hypothetical protein
LLNVWNKFFMRCRKDPRNAQYKAAGKSWKRDFVDIRHAGYVPLSHGEEVGGVGEGRRGFEEEGDGILKTGGEKREGVRARLSRFRISRSG